MKTIKITYQCDFCKGVIDTDSDTVRAILPGRIGYKDSFLADTDDQIRHYHDYCLEHILSIQYKDEEPEPEEVEEEPEPEEVEEEPVIEPEPEPKRNRKKDLGKLQSLINAKWTKTKIADEFGVSEATIYNWINELKGR